MKYAIIAAGEGSRLASEGLGSPKPLVPLCGVPMIERLIRIFLMHDAEEIVIVVNRLHPAPQAYLQQLMEQHPTWPLRVLVATTPSSMHSLAVLAPHLQDSPFVLTTVDTVFPPSDFAHYIAAFRQLLAEGKDGLMAVTDYVDDEKPLYLSTDAQARILGFHDQCESHCHFISGGIYALTPRALDTLQRCLEEGQSRMRNFQRALIADGLWLQAHLFSKILDIDHASDVAKAEEFLQKLST